MNNEIEEMILKSSANKNPAKGKLKEKFMAKKAAVKKPATKKPVKKAKA